jgi:hypothetical protein
MENVKSDGGSFMDLRAAKGSPGMNTKAHQPSVIFTLRKVNSTF